MTEQILCETLLRNNRVWIPSIRKEGRIDGLWSGTEQYQVTLLDGTIYNLDRTEFFWIIR